MWSVERGRSSCLKKWETVTESPHLCYSHSSLSPADILIWVLKTHWYEALRHTTMGYKSAFDGIGRDETRPTGNPLPSPLNLVIEWRIPFYFLRILPDIPSERVVSLKLCTSLGLVDWLESFHSFLSSHTVFDEKEARWESSRDDCEGDR